MPSVSTLNVGRFPHLKRNALRDLLGRPFWAKPVLRRFPDPELGPSEEAVLDDLVSCWASGVRIGCCLNPVEGSVLLFRFVWWLDWLLLKEDASAFCSLRWLFEVFLAVEKFVGLRRWPASIWMIVLNTLVPLVGPLPLYRLLPKFAAQKEHKLWSFQSIPLLINSINLKRDGVKRCGKVKYWRLSYSVIVSISCQLHWVIELNIPRSGGVAEWRRIGECCLGGAALQSPH